MRRLDELVAALTLLTRLPVAGLVGVRAWPPAAQAVWAYPLVGALVGGVGGAVLWLAERRLSPRLAGLLAIAAMVLLTGGLHEDGLADTADGFGGGNTALRKLDIMRDSRIGSYGALALILLVALRSAALAELRPAAAIGALVAAGGLGRGVMVLIVMLLSPARADGVATELRHLRAGDGVLGLALAAAAACLLPVHAAMTCIAAALLAGAGMAALARRQVGGYSGDILGAAAAVAECTVLCVAAAGAAAR